MNAATIDQDRARGANRELRSTPDPFVPQAFGLSVSKPGEMDYILKVVTPDLKSLSDFVNGVLLPHDSVQHVKTAIVLETLKETSALPL